MKHSWLLAFSFLFLSLLLPTPSHSYTYVSAGAGVDAKDFSCGTTQWGIGMRYPFSQLGLDLAWRQATDGELSCNRSNLGHVALFFYLFPSSLVTPYFGGGYGWYRSKASHFSPGEDTSSRFANTQGRPLLFIGIETSQSLPAHLFLDLSLVPDINWKKERHGKKGQHTTFHASALLLRGGCGLF